MPPPQAALAQQGPGQDRGVKLAQFWLNRVSLRRVARS
jgi:hypothetical protein